MNLEISRVVGSLAIVAILISVSSCDLPRTGPVQYDSESVELDDAESVRVELIQDDGDLRVTGGADKLLDADFTYNVAAWQPEVAADVIDSQGTLSVEQPRRFAALGIFLLGSRNEWDIRLNNEVPIDLAVRSSYGDCYLEVDSLSLTGLKVDVSKSDVTVNLTGDYPSLTRIDFNTSDRRVWVDLTGTWGTDVDVTLDNSNFGEITLWLPNDVGVRVESTTAGEIHSNGLSKDGDAYVNDAYGDSEVALRITVTGESANIMLQLGE